MITLFSSCPRLRNWKAWYCHGVAWRHAPAAAEELRDQLALWNTTVEKHVPTVPLKQGRRHWITARGDLVMKRIQPRRGLWHRWRFAIRPSIARRACRLAVALRDAGLPVAEPLAYGCQRRYGLTVAELTVSARIDDVVPLTGILRHASAERTALLRDYGGLLGKFHANGFSNRDLKDENVLYSRSGGLWVVDLDGVRCHRWITRFRAARDWRAVVRSLAICGCDDDRSLALVLQGYNACVPARLRWLRVPWFAGQAMCDGRRVRAATPPDSDAPGRG